MPRQRVVLITGCSEGGIGWALCKEFAKAGSLVYATARRLESMASLEPLGCKLLALDVVDSAAREAVVKQVLDEAGRIDILINNAGVGMAGASIDVPLAAGRQLMDVNFFAPIALAAAAAPAMIAARAGVIVNVGSVAGYAAPPFVGLYSASKYALRAWNDALRVELAPFGVKVVYVAPGYIKTRIAATTAASGWTFLPASSPYANVPAVAKFVNLADTAPKGTPVDTFATGCAAALLSSAPPRVYVAGKSSGLMYAVGNYLPSWLTDWMFARLTGLTDIK